MLKNKLVYVIVAVVVLIALITGLSIYYFTSNNYVATVAGEKITKEEYTFFLNSVKQDMETAANAPAGPEADKLWTSKIEGKDAKDVAKDRALDYAKEFKIQFIEARKNNVVLEKTDTTNIDSYVDQVIKSQGGRAQAEADIKKAYGITLDQYKGIYKNIMLVSKFIQKQQEGITPNDQDAKNYYNEKLEKAGVVTTVRHVLFLTQDSQGKPLPEDKQQDAKKKADDILAKAKAGQNMSDLAKQYSEDPGSKDQGGLYTFEKGKMVKEFEDWSFSAKPGDAGIVKTTYGFHVIKKPTFDDLKASALQGAKSDIYNKRLEEWKGSKQYDVIKNQRVFDSVKVV